MKKLIIIINLIFLSVFAFADITVTPYGAAEVVSGSCFLLDSGQETVLVDCGIFMGKDAALYSNSDIPEDVVKADSLVLTHAHLDHSGRVPLLVNKGFKGKIYSTAATKELALALFKERNGFDIINRQWFWSQTQRAKAEDNNATAVAHWDEDCKENIKEVEYSGSSITLEELRKETKVKFLACKNCCTKDVKEIEKLFDTSKYEEIVEISENVKIKFIDAGHIPGSASVIFYIDDKKVLFSGDIGSGYSRLNGGFSVPEKADMVFMEATYADEKNVLSFDNYKNFRNDLLKAVGKGKTVWIPALAFNRTQKVLYELKLMQKSGELPQDLTIYSVSPSANDITKIYQKELKKNAAGDWFLEEIYKEKNILPDNLKQSKSVKFDKPLILISSSGDMDKGMSARFTNVLLPRKDVSIMLVNYVSPESAAGRLLSGKGKVNGIKSAASIKKYDVFSDHADFAMIQKWLSGQNKKTAVYLIHSEKESADKMRSLLNKDGWGNVFKAAFKEKAVLAIK